MGKGAWSVVLVLVLVLDILMIRGASIAISFETMRHLRWAAEALDVKAPDALAEQWLRERLLERFPNIAQIVAEYDRGREKLNREAVQKLTTPNP